MLGRAESGVVQSRAQVLTWVQLDHVQDELADGRIHQGEVIRRVVLASPVGQKLRPASGARSDCSRLTKRLQPQRQQAAQQHTLDRSKSARFSRKSSAMTQPMEKTSCMQRSPMLRALILLALVTSDREPWCKLPKVLTISG